MHLEAASLLPINMLLGIYQQTIFSARINPLFSSEKIEMSAKVKQVIENIKNLSADEKALVAHCLISSLEKKQDEDVDEAWADLAEKRYSELSSGEVRGVDWDSIKKDIKG